MDSLISRQAAIDAIEAVPDSNWTSKRYSNEIRKLPSAQPEQRWIPCSERLPEPGNRVLVSIGGEVDVDWISIDNILHGNWYRALKIVKETDAWMSLPEPARIEDL